MSKNTRSKKLVNNAAKQKSTKKTPLPTEPRWGRRRADQTFKAKFNRMMARRAIWAAVPFSAAGLVFTLGWPTVIGNIADSGLERNGRSQTVIAAEATSLALVKSLTGERQIWSIATHSLADGTTQVLAGESGGDIQVWDSKTGETVRTLSGHRSGIRSLAISRSGQWLVSGARGELRVWNPMSGELVHTIPVAASATEDSSAVDVMVAAVAIAPDERTFISSTRSGRITAWDMASGTERYSLENESEVWSVAIAPDSQSFVSGAGDRTIRQWDISTGRLLQEFAGHQDSVRAVAISPDGQTLASGSWDQTIKLWSLATGDLQTTLNGHTDQIFSLAISPDGKTLASSSTDRTLKLWNLPKRELTETLDDNTESVVAVTFAADLSDSALETQSTAPVLVSGGRAQTVNIWQ